MEIKNLTANPDNPRRITDAKLIQLKKALNEFGDLGGFVFNRKTKQLVGGHQRAKLFEQNAKVVIETVHRRPTRTGTVAEGYVVFNGERFKYREVSWDPQKEKAANIAANKGAGEWDPLKLDEWFKELEEFGFDLDLTMFDSVERGSFLENKSKKGLTEDDAVPEKVATRCKLGDLWVLGEHWLLCGDSTNAQHVERLMDGEKADFVYCDPPYGMNLNTDYSTMVQKDGRKGNKFSAVIGDDKDFDPRFYFEMFKDSREQFWFGADYYCQLLPKDGSWVVWDKRESAVTGSQISEEMFGSMFELCWSKSKHKRDIARIMWAGGLGEGMGEDRKGRNNSIDRSHPTQKPIMLAEWFFERWGKPADLVADLFLGSGSTLIACEKTGRRCFGMEIDPHYCDVIVTRWEKFTGKKAKLQKSVHSTGKDTGNGKN